MLSIIPACTGVGTGTVIPGRLKTPDMLELKSAKTMQGDMVVLSAHNGFHVNDANVIIKNIDFANGIIHEIDKVILQED